MATKKKQGDRLEGMRTSLEESITESIPGLKVLDRDLDYGGRTGVDLVAADSAGALTFVLLVEGGGDEPILAALDVLAFARREHQLLARHLGRAGFRQDLAPRVILVSEAFDQTIRERLPPLVGARVELFELRELKSAAATRSYLIHRGPGTEDSTGAPALEAFLDSIPEEHRELAALAMRRIGRIDTDLTIQPAEGTVTWLLGSDPLCAVEWCPDGLVAQTASGQPTTLDTADALDRFLEQVLGDYVAGLEDEESWEDLEEVDLVPGVGEAILTPEEIEAFRD